MYNKSDLEILGLDESFTREQLEYEYSLILKRAKSDPQFDISKAEEAYNRILGLKQPEKISEEEQKKRNRKMKLAENSIFFIAGGILLLILAITIPSTILRKSIDLHICISGQFAVGDTETLKQEIRPEVKSRKTSIEFIYASFATGDDSASYSLQALSLSLLAGDYDLMITDYQVFRFLVSNPSDLLVKDISEYLDDLGISQNDDRLIKLYGGIYGIRVLKSDVLDKISSNEEGYYLSIPNKADDIDNAISAIEKILYN
ncbi:MAG TPA: hypothetical protein PLT91_01300 [Clostridia bacterium]|nr:MAG: hypothetical protein BWX97_00652 [Firmicutes bacterium ADurb.Bin146]HOD92502.1 hypothetical protein [Clostridia bacterium]HQM38859.1 hypothetical protein [Clostridia bacterium]